MKRIAYFLAILGLGAAFAAAGPSRVPESMVSTRAAWQIFDPTTNTLAGVLTWLDTHLDDYLTGVTGPAGPAGADGANGTNGAVGATGPMGTNGVNGTNGLSAYEVAVTNGFGGDLTAWLASLVGAAGADGADGADGANGLDGATGATGPPGPVTNFLGLTETPDAYGPFYSVPAVPYDGTQLVFAVPFSESYSETNASIHATNVAGDLRAEVFSTYALDPLRGGYWSSNLDYRIRLDSGGTQYELVKADGGTINIGAPGIYALVNGSLAATGTFFGAYGNTADVVLVEGAVTSASDVVWYHKDKLARESSESLAATANVSRVFSSNGVWYATEVTNRQDAFYVSSTGGTAYAGFDLGDVLTLETNLSPTYLEYTNAGMGFAQVVRATWAWSVTTNYDVGTVHLGTGNPPVTVYSAADGAASFFEITWLPGTNTFRLESTNGWEIGSHASFVTTSETARTLDWTNASVLVDIPVTDAEAANKGYIDSQLDLLFANTFFGSTNAHSVLPSYSAFTNALPGSWTQGYSLSAGTNAVGARLTESSYTFIPAGLYQHMIYMSEDGAGTYTYFSQLIAVSTNGATTNVLGTASLASVDGSAVTPYISVTHVSSNWMFASPVYLGILRYAVRTGGGVVTLTVYGGAGYPTHLNTPTLQSAGYLTTSDIPGITNGLVPTNRTVTVNNQVGTLDTNVAFTTMAAFTNGTTGWFDGALNGSNGVYFTKLGTNYWLTVP